MLQFMMLSIICLIFWLDFATSQPPPPPPNTNTGEKCDANGADASYSESLETENNIEIRTISASGCPNHAYDTINPNDPSAQDWSVKVKAKPCLSNQVTNITCTLGMIGVAFDGVAFFGMAANTECGDAVVAEGDTFDQCSGHAAQNGDFHYHIPPACLISKLKKYYPLSNDQKHGNQIGWALDGLPIYGPYQRNGEYILPCTDSVNANQSDCVDECNGHWHDLGSNNGFKYHYHFLGEVGDTATSPVSPLPGTEYKPYFVGCLKGLIIDEDMINKVGITNQECVAENLTNNEYVAKIVNVDDIFDNTAAASTVILLTNSYYGVVLLIGWLITHMH